MGFAAVHEVIADFFAIPKNEIAEFGASEESNHFVFKIEEFERSIRIYAVTQAGYGVPESIHARLTGKKSERWDYAKDWKPSFVFCDKEIIIYSIDIPAASLSQPAQFYIRERNSYRQVFSAFSRTIVLPPSWRFSAYNLYLTYDLPEFLNEIRQRAFVREIVHTPEGICVRGALITSYRLNEATLTIRKFRDEGVNWSFPLDVYPAARIWGLPASAYKEYRGEWAYKFECVLKIDWNKVKNSIYSLMVHVGDKITGLHAFNKAFSRKDNLLGYPQATVFAFIDAVSRNLRLEKFSFGVDAWPKLLEQPSEPGHSRVCLIGEYTNSARDNGLHLFNYLRNDPDLAAFYVGERGCGVEGDKVLEFGSLEHLTKCLDASVIAFTHHPSYVFPHFAEKLRKSGRPKTFFLQHGVTALKNSMQPYHSSRKLFDAFNVCSSQEAETIRLACKYPPQNIAICGFPRFDHLYQLSRAHTGQADDILVFPTWRRGLDKRTTEEFCQTEFCQQWIKGLIALGGTAKKLGAKIRLVSHPIIARHVAVFEPYVDSIVDVEDIQSLIASSACLITDYSSIVFDSIYAGKPVFFYTFDEEEFRFREEAFIDTETQLPGVRAKRPNELAAAVEIAWPDRSRLSKRTLSLLPSYFAHIDDQNCARIKEKIEQLLSPQIT